MYFLYIQNNYNLDFNFKKYTSKKGFIKILQSLYKENSNSKNKLFLFKDIKLLGSLFFPDDKFKLEDFLNKLEKEVNSTNYVSSNIEILDYLGNTENDTNIINQAFCIILLKEMYPDIKISKKFTKIIFNNLLKCIKINKNLTYTNTNAIMIFFLLKKHNLIPEKELENFINILVNNQQNDGRINNGFNKFFITKHYEIDILHTIFNLIVLLEYKIILTSKKITNKNIEIISSKNIPKLIKNTEDKSNNSIEHFDNILIDDNKYYIDINFYNTTAILSIILIFFLYYKLKNILY